MAETLTHVASYADIPFPCMSVNGNAANALAKTTYPYREGQSIRNLGRLGERWEIVAVFNEDFNGRGPYPRDLWPHGWLRLKEALQDKERAQFDHPFFGRAWAQCAGFTYEVDNTNEETLHVRITFEEDNLDEPTYDLVLAEDTVTVEGGEERAAALDADLLAALPSLPSADRNLFGSIWATFVLVFLVIDDLLNYDDVVVAVNTLSVDLAEAQDRYAEVILSPVNWRMALGVGLMRRDATILAQQFAGKQRRIIDYQNKVMRSALEIVVEIYSDPARETEFLMLNDVSDPLFVPPGIYRVYAA